MRPARILLSALVAVFTATGVGADNPTRSGFSMYIARIVATAVPYHEGTRWEAYLTLCRIAQVLWNEDRWGDTIATLDTQTFDGYPLLFLTDQEGDGKADFFAYHATEERDSTQEFGAFFTATDAREPVWLVFNNGTIPETLETDEWVFYWATHHFIDRTGDGRFDLYIGSGTDTDEDGKSGTEDTLWLYDDDQDGLIDRAETIVDGTVRTVEPVDGTYHFGGTYGRDVDAAQPFFDFPDAIAADILKALEGAEQ